MTVQIGQLIDQVNSRLNRVKILKRGKRLYIRGRFPAKPGDGERPKRYEISTGYRAIHRELKLAEALAKEVESQLVLEKFDWALYLKGQQKSPETVAEWVDRLEKNYWNRREKNLNSQNTWRKSYQQYYNKLPQTGALTEELLKKTLIDGYKPSSRSRQLCSVAYGMLAEFAGLPREEISELGKGYKPAPKTANDILTDEHIVGENEACRSRAWQWMAGMQATFGLRNHELFRLDTSRLREGIVRVLPNTKTGERLAYACPFEWIERFRLWEIEYPSMEIEGKSNNNLGSKISKEFKKRGLSKPYMYRDAYAIRLEFRNISSSFGSRWMGHSAAVHDQNYLDAIQEIHHQRMYERLKQSEQTARLEAQFRQPAPLEDA